MCLQVKKYIAASQDGSKQLPSLSDLDIVTIFTDIKHLQGIQTVAVEETLFPFIQNPISFATLNVEYITTFGKVVDEMDCLSDFEKDIDSGDDGKEEIFHDCEGIPYCLEGEKVIDAHMPIDEIVPITRNIAYIRCGVRLYMIIKRDGQWENSFI